MTGDKFAKDRIMSLIETGSRSEWQSVGRGLGQSPEAKADVESAIRNIMADKASKSVRGTIDLFDRKVKDALTETGLMSTGKINEISAGMKAIENLKIPEQEKLGIMRRFVIVREVW